MAAPCQLDAVVRRRRVRALAFETVSSCDGGRHEYQDQQECCLGPTDPRIPTRVSEVGRLALGQGDAPLDQANHRAQFKQENEAKEAHLDPEEVVPEVVSCGLLEAGQETRETGGQP